MSHVLLRLDEVEGHLRDNPSRAHALVQELRGDAKEALKELRAISAGLFLPDIGDTGDVEKVVQSIVYAHEGRTNCNVAYRAENVPKRLSRDIVRCVARVVQEALNNSYRHSGAMEQSVCLSGDDSVLKSIDWRHRPRNACGEACKPRPPRRTWDTRNGIARRSAWRYLRC